MKSHPVARGILLSHVPYLRIAGVMLATPLLVHILLWFST